MTKTTDAEIERDLLVRQARVQLEKSCQHVGALCDKFTKMGLMEWFDDAEAILTELVTMQQGFTICFPPE